MLKGLIKKMAIYNSLKQMMAMALNAFDGMFEFSAHFKFADLISAEFSGKVEIPLVYMQNVEN